MHSPVLFQMIPRHALNAAQVANLTERIERSGLRNICPTLGVFRARPSCELLAREQGEQ